MKLIEIKLKIEISLSTEKGQKKSSLHIVDHDGLVLYKFVLELYPICTLFVFYLCPFCILFG